MNNYVEHLKIALNFILSKEVNNNKNYSCAKHERKKRENIYFYTCSKLKKNNAY